MRAYCRQILVCCPDALAHAYNFGLMSCRLVVDPRRCHVSGLFCVPPARHRFCDIARVLASASVPRASSTVLGITQLSSRRVVLASLLLPSGQLTLGVALTSFHVLPSLLWL